MANAPDGEGRPSMMGRLVPDNMEERIQSLQDKVADMSRQASAVISNPENADLLFELGIKL